MKQVKKKNKRFPETSREGEKKGLCGGREQITIENENRKPKLGGRETGMCYVLEYQGATVDKKEWRGVVRNESV